MTAVYNPLEPRASHLHAVQSALEMSVPDEPEVPLLEETVADPSSQPKKPARLWQRFLREVVLETLLPAWLVITFVAIPVGVRGESMNQIGRAHV